MAAKTFRVPGIGRQFFKRNLPLKLMVTALFWLAIAPTQAAIIFSNLVTFNGTNGANPSAGLVQGTDGNFYGTTYNGGTNGDGTVFRMTPAGVLTTLASFNGANGANPSGALVQGTNGNFYGTTSAGGTNGGYGTVFQITPGGVLTSLFSFANTNGANPAAPLVLGSNGLFYGTTYNGGTNGDNGTVFKMTPTGLLTTLVHFNDTDGANPQAPLTQGPDVNFYGTTAAGGTHADKGTVFRMTGTGALTSLMSFDGANGEFPSAGLTLGSDGNFYGTTVGGGANGSINGTVFRMTTSGVLTTLVSFNNTNGATPYCSPVQGPDGSFYGTTSAGGASNVNFGTIFEVTPNGAMASLYSFSGSFPYAGLVRGNDGNYYGTTYGGATYPNGTVFRVTIPPLPVIESVAQNGSTVAITWSAIIGQKYQAQYSTSLNPSNWQSLGSPITATSVSMSASDTIGAKPQCFYRVALLP